MIKKPILSIIGPGNVGSTLAYLAHQSQHYEVVMGSRDTTKAKPIGEAITLVDTQTAANKGDIVLLTVPDTAIHSVCKTLSQAHAFKAGAIIAHCSGALSSDELLVAKNSSHVHLASLHPLQTFPSFEDAIDRLHDCDCFYESDDEAKPVIEKLISHFGMRALEIQKQAKVLYHTSAVIACNYLSALMDAALEVGEAAGIERSILWPSLEPLVTSTLANISNKGTEGALTGPVARGDINTVQQHTQALSALPSEQAMRLSQLYGALGTQTVKLAKAKDSVTAQAEKSLLQLFSSTQVVASIHSNDRE